MKTLQDNVCEAIKIRSKIDKLTDEKKALDTLILKEMKKNDLGSFKTEDGASVSVITKESFTSLYSDTVKKKISGLKAEIKSIEEKESARLDRGNEKPVVTEFVQVRRAIKK